MANIRRYSRAPILVFGQKYGTSMSIPVIRENMQSGNIRYTELITQESERLDILAGEFYDDGRLWWIIAAASDVGWGLQVPPGTLIKIPTLEDVAKYTG